MALIWKKWCRLCAQEDECKLDLSSDAVGSELLKKISKYLSLQVNVREELPDAVCRECCDVLSRFDVFATKCSRIQSMFQIFLKGSALDDVQCKSIREEYLVTVDIDENKFIPICNLKTEEDKKDIFKNEVTQADDGLSRSRQKRLITRSDVNKNRSTSDDIVNVVKNEVMSDVDDNDAHPSSYTSDDDYLPLANVTSEAKNLAKTRKRKASKKIKTAKKSKRKKVSKAKTKDVPVLNNMLDGEEVNVKIEQMSDDENATLDSGFDKDGSIDKKEKRERKKSTVACLKYDCYICGEDCRNWHALCVHFRDVHDARAKVMCCCGKFLASRVSIGRHCAKHSKGANTHNCLECHKSFPRESELSTHMISHLPKEQYPYVCCKCARRFTTQQLLRHHEKKHVPMEQRLLHLCQVCHSKFASKSSLMMHMKAVHERLKPFVCDQCGRAFTTKGILEEHQVRHSDARPHVCSTCHKSFKTKQRLAIHSDTHNDTVYQCPHCPIQLNSRRTLRMHLFVHDEVCRYQCSFCDKAFKRAKDLKNHSNLHTGRRPYSCPWCSRTFANGSNCRAHKRRMHPNELRISDATAAMVNKVPVTPEEEALEKKAIDTAGAPKVIYTTVKRKNQPNTDSSKPNFSYTPDVTEKIDPEKATEKVEETSKTESSTTKLEKTSPVHNYESSMSPLNLNTTASNKYPRINAANNSISIIPVNEAIAQFTDENFQQVQNSILQRSLESYTADGEFNKNPQQLYGNFSATGNVASLYGRSQVAPSAASNFNNGNPYGLHYSREDDNN